MSKEIKIKIRPVEYADDKGKKKSFTAYKAVQKDGKMVDCKFRKAVDAEHRITEDCIIVVPDGEMNMTRNTEFPCLWVNKVDEIKPWPKTAAVNTDDLPF